MKRIAIYEYDRRNREAAVEKIAAGSGNIISWSMFTQENGKILFSAGTKRVFVDATSLFGSEERPGLACAYLEKIISIIMQVTRYEMFLIVERQYSQTIKNLVYFRVSEVRSLEELLELEDCFSRNIADISQGEFDEVFALFDKNFFGNTTFKRQLKNELEKFRVFNATGQQHIFSMLLCGPTGIGKTEVARLLHRALSPNEPMIKVNFGNYSSKDSLNSLIGSPRGYIGSSKGELSEKLSDSRATIILIDELEKATKPVFNFFLQLLEDGQFTDSQGRDYALDKYIVVFTSNIDYSRINELLSPELCSRFNLIYKMNEISDGEKRAYVSYKVDSIIRRTQQRRGVSIPGEALERIKDIDVTQYRDMRRINAEIMLRLAQIAYPLIYPQGTEPEPDEDED